MSSPGDVAGEPALDEPGRGPWLWISVVLAVVCVALLAWGLSTKSDLDTANDQIAALEAQISEGKEAGAAAATSYKAAYDDLEDQLGPTSADLAKPKPISSRPSRRPSRRGSISFADGRRRWRSDL